MSDAELRAMPIKRFWLYSRSIDRIQAEMDGRHLRVLLAKSSKEAFEETTGGLNKQMGTIIEIEELSAEAKREEILNIKTDPGAIAMLKSLAGQKLGHSIG